MTTGTVVLSGSVRDFWTTRISVMLSSITPTKTDVRFNTPDTKTMAVTLSVQLAFTVHVPVSVSLAKSPPTHRASVPTKVPSAWRLTLPAAAMRTAPVGRSNVPLAVNPYGPAAPAIEHVWARADGAVLTTNIANTISTSVVGPSLRFITILLIGFFRVLLVTVERVLRCLCIRRLPEVQPYCFPIGFVRPGNRAVLPLGVLRFLAGSHSSERNRHGLSCQVLPKSSGN